MFCKKCGKKIPDNSKFCLECGYEVDSKDITPDNQNKTVFCTNCGNQLSATANFCSACGYKTNNNSNQFDTHNEKKSLFSAKKAIVRNTLSDFKQSKLFTTIKSNKKKTISIFLLLMILYSLRNSVEVILCLLFLSSIIILILGMIKPQWIIRWGKEKYQKRVYVALLSVCIFFISCIGIVNTTPPNPPKQQTIKAKPEQVADTKQEQPTDTEQEQSTNPEQEQPADDQDGSYYYSEQTGTFVQSMKYTNIIGTPRDEIATMFDNKDYYRIRAYQDNVEAFHTGGNNGVDAYVIFNENNIAKGVIFLSSNPSTGDTSYVNTNYNQLIKWATGGNDITIENDVGFDSSRKYPSELYIGDCDDDN